ncbi:MAG TPA: MFS transporter [Syntrophorhabdaceae bacterium]|nr:MFS transporter [Syntrophorhabdaceae bacterium]
MVDQNISESNVLTRDFILAFFAFFCFASAFHSLTPTLPIFLAGLGSAKQDIGILVGTIGMSSLGFRFVVGRLLGKYHEKQILLWGMAAFGLTFLALAVVQPFWPFFTVRLIQGVAFACLDTAVIAYVIRIMPLQYRTRVINYFMLAPPLASGLATSTSVFVMNGWGFTAVLLGCTGLALCAFLLITQFEGRANPAIVSESLAEKRRFFEKKIVAPALVSFLCVFSSGGILAFYPLYAVQCGVRNPGVLFSAMAIMFILSRLTSGRILSVYNKERILIISVLIMMSSLTILAFSSTLPMFILVGLLWGIGFGIAFPLMMAYSLEYAGSSDGIAIATYQAFMDLGLALGPAVAGILLPLTGYRMMFLSQAMVCVISLLYFQFYLRKRVKSTRTI